MFKVILATSILAALALGIWASSDLWSPTSEVVVPATGKQENVMFHVTGMT